MTKPVIYLDIDGVLNNSRHPSTLPKNAIMRFKMGDYILTGLYDLFMEFYHEVRPSIVIVSSWAINNDLDKLSAFFQIPLFGKSDYCGGGLQRGQGVIAHAARHGFTRYGVLDDAGTNCYEDMSRVVAPVGRIGITPDDLMRLRQILG